MAQQQTQEFIRPLHKTLLELGLTEHEAKLYSISLQLGPSLVSTLAKQLGISRPNVYKVIEGLEKHGLAQFSTKKGYGKRLAVKSPTKVVELLRKKKKRVMTVDRRVADVMPELMALYKQGELPTKVDIFQEYSHIITAFEQVFEEVHTELIFFGSSEDLNTFVTMPTLSKQINKRVRRQIPARILVFPGNTADMWEQRDKEELRETRTFTKTKKFIPSCFLYANKALILQTKTPLVMRIEDEYIVEMLCNMFETLWQHAEKN